MLRPFSPINTKSVASDGAIQYAASNRDESALSCHIIIVAGLSSYRDALPVKCPQWRRCHYDIDAKHGRLNWPCRSSATDMASYKRRFAIFVEIRVDRYSSAFVGLSYRQVVSTFCCASIHQTLFTSSCYAFLVGQRICQNHLIAA